VRRQLSGAGTPWSVGVLVAGLIAVIVLLAGARSAQAQADQGTGFSKMGPSVDFLFDV
jgi:hypothetical protein